MIELTDLTDEDIAEELTRDGWLWGDGNASPEERAIALTHEALRRIMIHNMKA